uniref:Uncharacterized protein n=1 Tax=Knipowitschia caucasica TaxID=637954 RepID=A0AAV2MA97_KNICA
MRQAADRTELDPRRTRRSHLHSAERVFLAYPRLLVVKGKIRRSNGCSKPIKADRESGAPPSLSPTRCHAMNP